MKDLEITVIGRQSTLSILNQLMSRQIEFKVSYSTGDIYIIVITGKESEIDEFCLATFDEYLGDSNG